MELDTSGWRPALGRLSSTLLILTVATFLWKLVQARMYFYRFKRQGLPMPKWNPIFGHLTALPPLLSQLPKRAQQSASFGILARDFRETGIFYLDLWPFSYPMIVVNTPDLADQVCHQYDLEKPDSLLYFFKPITGGLGLFMMNGEKHKSSRALFTPGFSENVIREQTKNIVEEAKVYTEILRDHARKGDMFLLDDLTCWYMMDVIGTVTLDARLGSQRSENVLASAMRDQVNRHVVEGELNPFIRYNPMLPVMQWYNGYKMDRYISKELDERYHEWRSTTSKAKAKSVIDLALADYMRGRSAGAILDPEFKAWACAQIRLFLFVGHDSTAATIVYCYYLLSKNPDTLRRVRAEHESVFGTDFSNTAQLLVDRPQLANQLPYTTAVIKEALRLFPPAASFRGGRSDAFLRGTNGQRYPTDGFGVWVIHDAIHRHPDYWPKPDAFLPERWLVGPDHPLYPQKYAWRPFEFGSHNCIGQTLVMLDIKVTLLMTLREFDIKDAYNEWDKLHPSKDIQTVHGERAFQVAKGSAHPADGFPCRVYFRRSA